MNSDSTRVIKYVIWIIKPWGIKEHYFKICLVDYFHGSDNKPRLVCTLWDDHILLVIGYGILIMLKNSVLDWFALKNTIWLLVISISHATLILESLDLKLLWVLGWFVVYFDLRLMSLVMRGKYGYDWVCHGSCWETWVKWWDCHS